MPAIKPALLKKQAVDRAALYGQPAAFVRELHSLLDRYTDYTHRSGEAGEPFPLMGAYNTPPPVMRQVWVELTRKIKAHPEYILPLCDALWAEANYDINLLAARLLGQVSINPPGPVLERIQAWVSAGLDKRLLDGVLEHGLEQFQHQAHVQVLEVASSWLAAPDVDLKQAGLRLLVSQINQSGEAFLPVIFKLITPYLRIAPSRLRPDILAVLTSLAHISPAETAYLLRQNLAAPDNPDTPWLIRKVLDEFPEETKQGVKLAMKAKV